MSQDKANENPEFDPENIFASIINSKPKAAPTQETSQPKEQNNTGPQDDRSHKTVVLPGGLKIPAPSGKSGFGYKSRDDYKQITDILKDGPEEEKLKSIVTEEQMANEIRPLAEKLIEACDKLGLTSIFSVYAPSKSDRQKTKTIYSIGPDEPPSDFIDGMMSLSSVFKENHLKMIEGSKETEKE